MYLRVALALIVMAAGRAMTIAFIGRAGAGGPGDPPAAWLMPLVGDAIVGVGALVVAILVWRFRNPTSWLISVVWSAIGAFDALAAYLVEISAPWPDFFMLEIFGRSMFIAAIAMQLLIIALLTRVEITEEFGVRRSLPEV